MSWLRLALLLACVCVLGACASARAALIPNPKLLCGTWAGEGMSERWWIEGRDLRGEGHSLDDAGEPTSTERLVLRAGKRGHVYVAQPGEAAPTEFSPIDPEAARYVVQTPAAAHVWVWANYEHDFPQEIHYALIGDRLEAVIAGADDAGGGGMGWTLERVAACDEAESSPDYLARGAAGINSPVWLAPSRVHSISTATPGSSSPKQAI